MLAAIVPFGKFFTFILRLAIRATSKGDYGKFRHGELWKARSKMSIAPGESVKVTGMDGLTLDVEPEKDAALAPKAATAIDV